MPLRAHLLALLAIVQGACVAEFEPEGREHELPTVSCLSFVSENVLIFNPSRSVELLPHFFKFILLDLLSVKKEYGGLRVDQAKRLKGLEQENARSYPSTERDVIRFPLSHSLSQQCPILGRDGIFRDLVL